MRQWAYAIFAIPVILTGMRGGDKHARHGAFEFDKYSLIDVVLVALGCAVVVLVALQHVREARRDADDGQRGNHGGRDK